MNEHGRTTKRSRLGLWSIAVIMIAVMMLASFTAGFAFGEQNSARAPKHTLAFQPNAEQVEQVDYVQLPQKFNNFADIFRAVENSVVSINTIRPVRHFAAIREIESAGSGIIFHETDERIYIVTNYHVVQNATTVTISLDDVRNVPTSFVVGYEANDLAVISALRSDLAAEGITGYTIATFGNSNDIEIGNFVLAVGNAYGTGQSATLGIISAKNRTISLPDGVYLDVIQTDAAINPGNSGGPLVNTNGHVIGINTAKLVTSNSEGMGYAIPSNQAARIILAIMEQEDLQTPFFGVSGGTVTEEHRIELGLELRGAFVVNVVRGFAAQQMGVMPGDVITNFNGTTITDWEGMAEMIRSTPIGAPIEVTVLRQGSLIVLNGNMTAYSVSNTNF